jgi:long-chain acyl-CoA synthetase
VAHPLVREMIGKEVDAVNEHLAQFETVKRFALLDHDFTFEGGQVTYTMKVRRRAVEERYADVIDTLFAEDGEIRPIAHKPATHGDE